MKILLALAIFANLALAAFLIGLSGFIFGGGPDGMNAALWPAVGWCTAFALCFVAPAVGFLVFSLGKPGLGALIAWMPAIAAVIVAFY